KGRGMRWPSVADRFGGIEVEPASEHAQDSEDRSLAIREQVIAPIERSLHRLLPGWSGARAAGQHPNAVVEPCSDLLGRQHADVRGRKLDGERDASQPGADLRYRPRVAVGQAERRVDLPGSFDEETHRGHAGERDEGRPRADVWKGQGLD